LFVNRGNGLCWTEIQLVFRPNLIQELAVTLRTGVLIKVNVSYK
jgi:hypothetical protein